VNVTLRLFGELKQYRPDGPRRGPAVLVALPEAITILQLIQRLGIPYGGEEGQLVATVNDVEVSHETPLREGDVVSLFEPLAGG
jgi:molybdopterin converting factor small subunit